jgi:adenylate cyclase
MTVRLTDDASGSNLWGESLQLDLEKISMFARENDVVSRIAAAIADDYGVIPLVMGKETASGTPENASVYEALLRAYHYLRTLTEEDRAEDMVRKALLLDPHTQVTRYPMALVHYLRFRKDMYLLEAEHVLRLNPNHAQYVASVAKDFVMMGDSERGLELMRKAMRLNPHHPNWYHIGPFMDAYRRGEYDRAWTEAQLFNIPGLFWDPLLRAATLGQLDRRRAAGDAVEELLSLRPDFRQLGRELMRRLVYTEENAELLIAGLRKAGLDGVAEMTQRG